MFSVPPARAEHDFSVNFLTDKGIIVRQITYLIHLKCPRVALITCILLKCISRFRKYKHWNIYAS
jgi:hypothetical protein